MKAVLCKSLDGPDGLSIEDIPPPVAGPGEVVIAVTAVAMNFFDTLITRGKYQHKPELPFSPGGEVAGTVMAVGEGVQDLRAGQRVAAYIGWGGVREQVVAKASFVVPIPDGVTDEAAAGVSITYGTAIHGLRDRANVRVGDSVAILGAAGGAGLAAIEIAKFLGARVIAVASSPEKLAICREHGADVCIDYASTDLKQALRPETGGKGVDVVYDCVGGPHAEQALRAMAWQGRFLVVGFASGEIPKLPLNLLLVKGVSAIGVFWGESVKRDPQQHRVNMIDVLSGVAARKLKPRIHARYSLAETADAIRVLDRREATGKIIVMPSQ
jgi:NADPH:quinone reductase